MTGDELRARYHLLDQAAAGAVRSFNAVASTGSVAMVHFLDGGLTAGNRALLAALEGLDPERRALLREVTAVDGTVVVITGFLEGFRSLAEWLGVQPVPIDPAGTAVPIVAQSAPPPSEPDPPTPIRAVPDEVDAGPAPSPIVEVAEREDGEPAEAAASGVAPPPAMPAEPPPAKQEMGEFTRLFRASDLAAAVEAAQHAAPSGSTESTESSESAEPADSIESAEPAEPGAVAGSPADPHPAEPDAPSSPEEFAPPLSTRPPGEFTRMFQAQSVGGLEADPLPSADLPARSAWPEPADEPSTDSEPPTEAVLAARVEPAPLPAPHRAPEPEPTVEPSPRPVPLAAPAGLSDDAGAEPVSRVADVRRDEVPPPFLAPPSPSLSSEPEPSHEPEPAAWTPPETAAPGAFADAGATGAFAALRTPEPASEPSRHEPPAEPAPHEGDFSRLFRRLDLPAWAVPPSAAAQPAPPEPQRPAGGEAAGQPLSFGRGPALPADGYLDRLYAVSEAPEPGPALPGDPAPAALPPLPSAFSSAPPPAYPAPPRPAASPSPSAPPQAGGGAAGTGLLVGLGAILLLAVLLVAYFALR